MFCFNRRQAALLAALLCTSVFPQGASAEKSVVNVAHGNGLAYLPSYVVIEKKLLEKHTAAAGLPEAKLNIVRVTLGRDLLLTGETDLVSGGGTSMLSIWDKTSGAQEVKAIMAQVDMKTSLVSIDPDIKTLADIKESDRIAVPALKTSVQALVLQQAAAKEFGWDQRSRFDTNQVQLSNPDAVTMLLSGGGEVKTALQVAPFNVLTLESGKAHEVMNSIQYLGRANTTVLYTNRKFKEENPKTYDAVVAAFEEAIDFINRNKREAAQIYIKHDPIRQGPEWVEKLLNDEDTVSYTSTPHNLGMFADLMHQLGIIKRKPESWKDLFWENAHDKDGS